APEQNCKVLLLLFFALFTAALAQQTDEPSHHESGQQKRDDYAHADEHIGSNGSWAPLDGPDGLSVGWVTSRVHPLRFFNVGWKIGRPMKGRPGLGSLDKGWCRHEWGLNDSESC